MSSKSKIDTGSSLPSSLMHRGLRPQGLLFKTQKEFLESLRPLAIESVPEDSRRCAYCWKFYGESDPGQDSSEYPVKFPCGHFYGEACTKELFKMPKEVCFDLQPLSFEPGSMGAKLGEELYSWVQKHQIEATKKAKTAGEIEQREAVETIKADADGMVVKAIKYFVTDIFKVSRPHKGWRERLRLAILSIPSDHFIVNLCFLDNAIIIDTKPFSPFCIAASAGTVFGALPQPDKQPAEPKQTKTAFPPLGDLQMADTNATKATYSPGSKTTPFFTGSTALKASNYFLDTMSPKTAAGKGTKMMESHFTESGKLQKAISTTKEEPNHLGDKKKGVNVLKKEEEERKDYLDQIPVEFQAAHKALYTQTRKILVQMLTEAYKAYLQRNAVEQLDEKCRHEETSQQKAKTGAWNVYRAYATIFPSNLNAAHLEITTPKKYPGEVLQLEGFSEYFEDYDTDISRMFVILERDVSIALNHPKTKLQAMPPMTTTKITQLKWKKAENCPNNCPLCRRIFFKRPRDW